MSIASKALLMQHDVDPKEALVKAAAPYIDDIEVLGNSVLVATYVRPEMTKSGIILSSGVGATRDEDIYQGKVQLVLKFGADAFVASEGYNFTSKPALHDWVVIRVGDSFQFKLGEVHCRLVVDTAIRAILKRPDIAL